MADTKKKKRASLSSFTILLIILVALAVITVIMAACGVEGIEGATLSGVLTAPVFGFQDAIGVCLFVMILGGFLGIVTETGALDAGIAALVHKLKGNELVLIPILMFIFSIGGTTYGMCEETVRSLSLKVKDKPVELIFGEHDAQCCVVGDKNRLIQVITNFINNAVKFTDEGSITLGYRTEGGELLFHVEDT